MGIFDRNPNEAAYVHGKKHIIDVIKNSGSGDFLIWKQPEEDFNTNSVLIVNPGEAAIFIKNGNIEAVFDNGRYSLSTENYPFISRLANAFSGGISSFNCLVFFVRTADSMEINWGTPSPLQVRDKVLGIATKLRARGAYKITIANPALFLTKLTGANIQALAQSDILRYFANEFSGKIKSHLTKALMETDVELLGIEQHLEELAEEMQPGLAEVYEGYGIQLVKFSISAMDIDDDELRRKYDEIGMEAIGKMRNAQADKQVMNILGDDWTRQQQVNILGSLASNPGGGVAGAGAGLGMGIAAGGAFGQMAQQTFAQPGYANQQPYAQPGYPNQQPYAQPGYPSQQAPQQAPPQATEQAPAQAAPQAPAQEDPFEVLGKLKRMLDAGLIEQEEYDAKKKEILSRM